MDNGLTDRLGAGNHGACDYCNQAAEFATSAGESQPSEDGAGDVMPLVFYCSDHRADGLLDARLGRERAATPFGQAHIAWLRARRNLHSREDKVADIEAQIARLTADLGKAQDDVLDAYKIESAAALARYQAKQDVWAREGVAI